MNNAKKKNHVKLIAIWKIPNDTLKHSSPTSLHDVILYLMSFEIHLTLWNSVIVIIDITSLLLQPTYYIIHVTLDHKPVISSTGIFVAIANIHCMGPKLSIFLLCQKSCSMKIFCKFPTVNISKLNFWLVIWHAKNVCTLSFQISNSCITAKYCPILTNHTSMGSLFI